MVGKTDRCIVLDLDLTLISTQRQDVPLSVLTDLLKDVRSLPLRDRIYQFNIENYQGPGVGTIMPMWGIARPHAKEFLSFCDQHFDKVVVWSAGKRPYVEHVVDFLFRDLRRPEVVYNHDMLDPNKGNGMVKTLTTILKEESLTHLDLSKTLALDDNPGTFADNTANGVLIPAYDPYLSIDGFMADDKALPEFQKWLTSHDVTSCSDVRLLAKHQIFAYQA